EIAVGDAARQLEIDHALIDAIARHDLAMGRKQRVLVERHGHAELAGRAMEPRRMAGIVDQLAVEHAGHFVDTVGHEEAAVEHGDLGVRFRQPLAVDVDDPGHDLFPQAFANGAISTPFSSSAARRARAISVAPGVSPWTQSVSASTGSFRPPVVGMRPWSTISST